MSKWITILVALTLSLTLIGGACAPAPAPTPAPAPSPKPAPAPAPVSAADFYAKNQVTMIVPTKPGGGTDFAARLFLAYWNETTGGTMKIDNKAGAGGVMGTNELYTSEPDGLTIALGDRTSHMVGPVLAKTAGVEYDINKFSWIGGFTRPQRALAASVKSPYESLEELKGQEGLLFGTESAGDLGSLIAVVMIELLELKNAKIVTGFGGSGELGLAIGRGEVDLYCWSPVTITDHIDKGWTKPPFVIIAFEPSPYFADVPVLSEVMEMPDQAKKELSALLVLGGGKIVYAPPGVPEDKFEFLREAFEKVMTNDGFLRQMALRWQVWEGHYSGETLKEEMEMLEEAQRVLARLDRAFEKYRALK